MFDLIFSMFCGGLSGLVDSVVCVLSGVCLPLVVMLSVCALLLLAAPAALGSDLDAQRPRHDSNLEICILLRHLCVCVCVSVCVCERACVSFS